MRLSQTVSPFGVGSIMDIEGESLMGADLSQWPFHKTQELHAPRIQRALGGMELRSAPSVPSRPSPKTAGIYYQRFPRWLFCQTCRRMHQLLDRQETGEPPQCPHCSGPLVPMRFIAVCMPHGHAMDVPWGTWAHSDPDNDDQARCRDHQLTFTAARGGTEGLSNLLVGCLVCKARRNLGDITATNSLNRIRVYCEGKQPWQRNRSDCDGRLEVLQRGATNVTISETTTALDIPEPSIPTRDIDAEVRAHRNFEDVRTAPTGPRAEVLIDLIAEDLEIEPTVVRDVLRRSEAEPNTDQALGVARDGLLADEWDAFAQAIATPDESVGTPDFVVQATPLFEDKPSGAANIELEKLLGSVVLVRRLREIRALHGFRRYDLSADLVDVNLGGRGRRWLPAVESFGEGIFLTLPEDRLTEWEQQDEVILRSHRIEKRRRASQIGSRFGEVTPRGLLLHTLAHLLIRRLAFTCGYSSASLRERVYASVEPNQQAGILIYTAAGDAEGTLGGLVRQGEAPRLAQTVLAALEDASWCSGDPVCRESRGQGLGSMNLSACHACSLISETSCERSNVLLDRSVVVGHDPTPGYFQNLLEVLRHEVNVG
jgi:hypothetical protein